MADNGLPLLGQLLLPLLSASNEDWTETAYGDLPLLNQWKLSFVNKLHLN
jgi:hypothetical protein